MPASPLRSHHRLDEIEGQQARPKVTLVERATKHGFVHALQLTQGETRWNQFEPCVAARIVQALLQSNACVVHNRRVIKREFGIATFDIGPMDPYGLTRIVARLHGMRFSDHEREVRNAHRVTARVATRITVGAKLFERDIGHVGFLGELTKRGCGEPFVRINEATWQRELPFVRRLSTPNEEHSQIVCP